MSKDCNTKEKIIQTAFSLFEKPRLKEISLSEIAANVGISKTAIFRHFKNKEELFDTLRERFLEDFSKIAHHFKSEVTESAIEESVCAFVDFSEEHPAYIGYFVKMRFTDQKLIKGLAEVLKKSGLDISGIPMNNSEPKNRKLNILQIYVASTLFYFYISYRCCCMCEGKTDIEYFKKRLTSILTHGMGRKMPVLSKEKQKELDEYCSVEVDIQDERFFSALASVFQECGMEGVTVEKLADAIGLAKSSLYSSFTSKFDMIKQLLTREIHLFLAEMVERVLMAETTDEMIYTFIHSEANYFSTRPNVVMLHGWLAHQGEAVKKEIYDEVMFGLPKLLIPEEFDIGLSRKSDCFVGWISALTAILIMTAKKNGYSEQWQQTCLEKTFEYIECGVI